MMVIFTFHSVANVPDKACNIMITTMSQPIRPSSGKLSYRCTYMVLSYPSSATVLWE